MKSLGTAPCADCGTAILKRSHNHSLCPSCKTKRHRQRNAEEWRNNPDVRERHRAYKADWRARNPELSAAKGRTRRYGITREEFNAFLADQGGRCAICNTNELGTRGWHLDHDHQKELTDATGWRGVLCHACNTGLGGFRDNVELLERAEAYLVRHKIGVRLICA